MRLRISGRRQKKFSIASVVSLFFKCLKFFWNLIFDKQWRRVTRVLVYIRASGSPLLANLIEESFFWKKFCQRKPRDNGHDVIISFCESKILYSIPRRSILQIQFNWLGFCIKRGIQLRPGEREAHYQCNAGELTFRLCISNILLLDLSGLN